MQKYLFSTAAAVLMLAFAPTALAQSIDFDEASDTAPFVVDRYAPATFESGVSYGGRTGVLRHGISAADGDSGRPPGQQGAFYRTQGMKFVLDPGVTEMSIDYYLDPLYEGDGFMRFGGFWGVGTDAGNAITAYPIQEFFRDDTNAMNTRGWDSGTGWTNMGLSSDFLLGTWATWNIKLDTGLDQFQYRMNGELLGTANAYGSIQISELILQGYNTAEGVTYNFHWDNFRTGADVGAIPEPTTWALMIGGFGMAGAMLRRKQRSLALA